MLTDEVVSSFDRCPSPRLRALMEGLVRHAHAFVEETGLTTEEWLSAIEFLTRTGKTCSDTRQEFILLSDVLGVSMAVVGVDTEPGAPSSTENTVLGPFFVDGAPAVRNGDDLAMGACGAPCRVTGTVVGTNGAPVAAARVDVWHADEEGVYDVQRSEQSMPSARGWVASEADGRFWFRTVVPTSYPVPTDGPVGELLAATGRGSMRPAHIHFMVTADGFEQLVTHVFVAGDPYLGEDAVFGVRESLVLPFVEQDDGQAVHVELRLRPASA
jgi:hydroxyquinol 1,2-dioxygenase